MAVGSSMVDASSAAARMLLNCGKERRAILAFPMDAKNPERPADPAGSTSIPIETTPTIRVPPVSVYKPLRRLFFDHPKKSQGSPPRLPQSPTLQEKRDAETAKLTPGGQAAAPTHQTIWFARLIPSARAQPHWQRKYRS
ncbi:hypothetical protein LHFGNBLO_004737 [Mesorhizobium sp. AR10]|uniref:hypothetical protein n=1 Tax=Mesorhizobium sp. AR10 TaxID=2865839 RepID=UPI00215E05F3|nr:hypothetical protein [Mesorhizobium sp. AR10]UVK37665.1 hypothetical protein LHFGNBLO_004737 [Mesorhizobium sp. AR10]